MLNILLTQLKASYIALEECLIINTEEFRHKAFKNIYNILNGKLMQVGKEHLTNSIWFNFFHEEFGYYMFDELNLRKAVSHFKNNQDGIYSPFELCIWITTLPIPFKKSLAIEAIKMNKILSQPFMKAKYILEASKFWISDKKLIMADNYTVHPICKYRDYSLIAFYATKLKKEIKNEIELIKPLLEKQFKENLKNYSFWIKSLGEIKNISEKSALSQTIVDFSAKFSAELLSKMMKP